MTYTIDLSRHASPESAGAALANMVNTNRLAKQYLSDGEAGIFGERLRLR